MRGWKAEWGEGGTEGGGRDGGMEGRDRGTEVGEGQGQKGEKERWNQRQGKMEKYSERKCGDRETHEQDKILLKGEKQGVAETQRIERQQASVQTWGRQMRTCPAPR